MIENIRDDRCSGILYSLEDSLGLVQFISEGNSSHVTGKDGGKTCISSRLKKSVPVAYCIGEIYFK